MTTIAYKDGVMASDSRLTAGSRIVPGNAKKIFRTAKAIVGVAGNADESLLYNPLFKTLASPDDIPKWIEGLVSNDCDWDLLVVFKNAPRVYYLVNISAEGDTDNSGFWCSELRDGEGMAIGSGSYYAVTAMGMGQSALEAVNTSMKYDSATGGRIVAVNV